MRANNFIVSHNPKRPFIHFFLKTLISKEGKVAVLDLLFKLISELQIIGILLYFPYQVMPNNRTDSLGFFVQKLSQYMSVSNVFQFDTASWIVNLSWVIILCYLIFLLSITAIVVLHYFLNKQLGRQFMLIWKLVGMFHYSCAFLPIHQYTLSLLNYQTESGFTIFGQDESLPFAIIAALQIPVNIFFAFVFSRFLYEPLKTNYLASRRKTYPETLILLYKIIDTPLAVFITNTRVQKWVRIVLMVLTFSANVKLYTQDVPYYHYKPMKQFTRLSFAYLGLTVSEIIMAILTATRDTQSFSSVYISIMLCIFFVRGSDIALAKMIKVCASQMNEPIKNCDDFYRKLLALEFVIENGFTRRKADIKRNQSHFEYLFFAILSNHKKTCNKGICGCQILSRSPEAKRGYSFNQERELKADLKHELIKEFYLEGLKKFPSDPQIKIAFANLLFETGTHSQGASISLIHSLGLANRNLEIKVLANILLEKIEKKIEENSDQTMNIKEVIDFQSLANELRKKIEANIAKYIEFWDVFKGTDPHVLKLHSLSVVINKEAELIGSVWNQIITKYPKLSYNDHLLFGLYQSLIRSQPYSAEKSLQTYFVFANTYDVEKLQEPNVTSENIYEPTNLFVYMSMKREKVGQIQFVTPNIEELLQYNPKELTEKNINIIMPQFYQERHQKILQSHLEKGKTSTLNENISVFGRKKNGYIIPFTHYTTVFPYFQEQLLYVGILRAVQDYNDYLLVLNDGTIDSMTERIALRLGLNPKSNRRYHLRDISRELVQAHKRFLPLVREALAKSKSHTETGPHSQSQFNFHAMSTTNMGEVTKKLTSTRSKSNEEERKKEINSTLVSTINEETLKLYEEYTTTGTVAHCFKLGQGGESDREGKSHKYGYQTTISEQFLLGSHLRIFKLHPITATNKDPEMVGSTKVFAETRIIEDNKDKTVHSSEPNEAIEDVSIQEASLPSDNDNVKIDGGDTGVLFRNPFSQGHITIPEKPQDNANNVANYPELASPIASPHDRLLPSDLFSNRTQPEPLLQVKSTMMPSRVDTFEKIELNSRLESTTQLLKIPVASMKTGFREEQQNQSKFEEHDDSVKTESSAKSGKAKKVEKMELKKFLKEHKIITAGQMEDAVDRSSVASTVRMSKMNSKLENAIYMSEKARILRILTWAIILFCMASVGMLIYTQTVIHTKLVRVKNNISILKLSYERLAYIVESNRRARRIMFIQAGLAPNNRHVADYVALNQRSMLTVSQNLTLYNQQVRNSIYKVDSSQQNLFYTLIPIKSKDNIAKIRWLNTFDLVVELANSALELYSMQPSKPTAGNLNLNFILNNTNNDLLVQSQNVVAILRADNTISIDTIQNTMIAVLCVVLVFMTLIYFAVVKTEMNFIRAKAHFLEVFLMIRDYEIEQHLHIANTFYTSLKENKKEDRFMERVASDKVILRAKDANEKKTQAKSYKAKKANFQGTNTQIVLNLIFTFIYLGIFGILFGVVLGMFNVSKTNINNARTVVIDAKIIYFRYGLIMASLYEYIIFDGTTYLLEQPIGSEWENLYSILTGSNTYLTSASDPTSKYDAAVQYALSGDLCPLFPTRSCYTDISGIASKGILGINGYLLKFGRGVKDFYDSSNKSTAAKTEALTQTDLLNSEILYEVYARSAYAKLDVGLTNQFFSEVDDYMDNSVVFIAISGVILIVATRLIWVSVSRRMDKERIDYRRMMRLIPVSVVMSNRFVKNYLFNHSKKILDTVKNKI